MFCKNRLSIVLLLAGSMLSQPMVYASHGHGGGGHGGGGGHMGGGGGHMGGGHTGGFSGGHPGGGFSGGHGGGFSGGHVGGFNGGHGGGFNGGHIPSGQSFHGGHIGGGQVIHSQPMHQGNFGVQHGISHPNGAIQHNGGGIQHNGGVIQHNSGMSAGHQNAIRSGTQHLGTHVIGSQNGTGSPRSTHPGNHANQPSFYQNHGQRQGGSAAGTHNSFSNGLSGANGSLHRGANHGQGLSPGANGLGTNHHGSQFLTNHAGQNHVGQNHNGQNSTGAGLSRNGSSFGHTNHALNHAGQSHSGSWNSNHSPAQLTSLSHHNFLSNHHVGNATSVTAGHHGSFLNGQGNHFGNHGLNSAGNFHHNQLGGAWNQGHGHHGNWNNANWHGGNWNHGNRNNNNWHHGNWNNNNWHHGNWNNANWHHGNWNNNWNNRWNDWGYGLGWGLGFGWGWNWGWGWGFPGYFWPYYSGLWWPYGGYGGYWGGYGLGLTGFGYGLNGLGYGYGLNNAYVSMGCIPYQPTCAYQPLTYGYASAVPGATYNNLGIGSNALAYAPQSLTALGVATATDAPPAVDPAGQATPPTPDKTSGASSGLPTADEFARIGELAFKSRDYKGAVRAWRHGLVDDPENPVLILMLSQALFATEQYSESAGAVQAAMQILPPEKWDVVVKNFRDLYGKGEDYTTQVRTLEKAAREKTDDAGLRFLLGYHYGFLGYPAEAVKQLEKCVKLAPRDEVARKLLEVLDDKLPKKNEKPGPGEPPPTTPPDVKPAVPSPDDAVPPPPPLNPDAAEIK